jgi:hypothetical protein
MKKVILALALAACAPAAHAADMDDCLKAWANAFENSDMSTSEVATNVGIAALVTTGTSATSSSTAAIQTAVRFAVYGSLVGGAILTVNQKWDLLARLGREAQVGAGSAISATGSALQEVGKKVSSTDVAQAVKENMPDEKMARLLCTDGNRPVLLGHYMELVISSLDKQTK